MTSSTPPAVAWLPWGPDAFARARAERRPVLLSITASWCHGCAVMDTTSYGDARVVAFINERLVAVRVDADRRPDVNDRYNLDGWPTTVLLTPSGEMLTGTTYLPAEGLLAMLEEVADAYARSHEDLDRRAAAVAGARRASPRKLTLAQEPDLAAPAWLAALVVRETDVEYGGFGTGGKFLHAAALTAAVRQQARHPDPDLSVAITRTLDGIAGGGARDQVGGGFFRYTASREWMRPHTEKMIEDQAAMVRLFLEAARLFDRQDYLDVARDTIAFVESTLASRADGRFFSSQAGPRRRRRRGSGRATCSPTSRWPSSAAAPSTTRWSDRTGRARASPITWTSTRACAGCCATRCTPPWRSSTCTRPQPTPPTRCWQRS
jgi:uncharacterized protein YyaL (SSP411 family)